MGTNYYRIPTVEEMEERRARLEKRVAELDMSVDNIERNFNTIPTGDWEYDSPWSEFTNETTIHLGKRSMGWKFCWNFHKDRYYKDKESLIQFVRSGRVINEYGEELTPDEFLEMAFEWGQPDGLIVDADYMAKIEHQWMKNSSNYYDRIVDGLRVSSSVDFC